MTTMNKPPQPELRLPEPVDKRQPVVNFFCIYHVGPVHGLVVVVVVVV